MKIVSHEKTSGISDIQLNMLHGHLEFIAIKFIFYGTALPFHIWPAYRLACNRQRPNRSSL